MGYSTEFYGEFKLNKSISIDFYNYINAFNQTRRMKRNNDKIKKVYRNWRNRCFNENLGVEGEYFVPDNITNLFGQNEEESIIDYNTPPHQQPGLWCQWKLYTKDNINEKTELNCTLAWDKVEKFYNYVGWLQYIIDNFLDPSDIYISGVVLAIGDDNRYDATYILVNENKITCYNALDEKNIEKLEASLTSNKFLAQQYDNVKKSIDEITNLYDDYEDEDY